MDIKIKDLFGIADNLVNQLSYMIDTYEELDPELDEIPTQTLDDIIEDIKSDPVDPEPDPEPTPDPEEPTDENDDNTSDTTDDTTNDSTTENTEEPTFDNNEEDVINEPAPSIVDQIIADCNIVISQMNALKNNAFISDVANCNCTDISNPTAISICTKLTNLLSKLYDSIGIFRMFYNGADNVNNRGRFIIDSYTELVAFTTLVTNIYNDLDSKAYLSAINGPIEKDYNHWVNVEAVNFLGSIDLWRNVDDMTYLNLIDESVQLCLKYAALLKKLVISDFKGFDNYYASLIEYIKRIDEILGYYETDYVKDSDIDKIIYDPSVLAKASAITMVTHVSIPYDPEEHND